jgi:hypothetical protein
MVWYSDEALEAFAIVVWTLAFVLFLVALALPCPLCRRNVQDRSTCCNKCVPYFPPLSSSFGWPPGRRPPSRAPGLQDRRPPRSPPAAPGRQSRRCGTPKPARARGPPSRVTPSLGLTGDDRQKGHLHHYSLPPAGLLPHSHSGRLHEGSRPTAPRRTEARRPKVYAKIFFPTAKAEAPRARSPAGIPPYPRL